MERWKQETTYIIFENLAMLQYLAMRLIVILKPYFKSTQINTLNLCQLFGHMERSCQEPNPMNI